MAEVILKQSNLSEIPLRVLANLPSTLPAAGYANLLCQDTVDGKRAFLRLPDGSLIQLFTDITETTIDNTVTNNSIVYEINDLPDPSLVPEHATLIMTVDGATRAWGWTNVFFDFIQNKILTAHRGGSSCAASKSLALLDMDTYISVTAAATLTLSSAVAWPTWCEFEIARNTSAAVTIAPSGVTVNGTSSNITISKENGLVVLKCIGLNTFRAYGDIS